MINGKTLKGLVRKAFRKYGYNIYQISNEERLALDNYEQQLSGQTLKSVFGSDVSRLVELKARYADVQLPIATHSVWQGKGEAAAKSDIGWGGLDLRAFRGHNAYIWSYTTSDPVSARQKYYIYADAVRKKDECRLFGKLSEDGAFGCVTFAFPGLGNVSRDLMDSVCELNFLNRHTNLLSDSGINVLDIGAGYGRLAYHTLTANPKLGSYTCVDAVPESTFLCEYYLKFRNLQDKVTVLPLHELENGLSGRRFDLAVNVHSFSECTYAAIEWWLNKVRELEVRYLMIVPNEPDFLSMEVSRERRKYRPLLDSLGYKLIAEEPSLDDPAARELIGADDRMYLFQLAKS